jgi:dihydrodipicolinate synthase/N-acetylneuraminate lyase
MSNPGGATVIGRLLTALLTPCHDDGVVDLDALGPLVEHQVAGGVDGLFLLGTAGQGPLLSADERRTVLRHVTALAGDRLRVVCHVGGGTTAEALDLLGAAEVDGAAAIAAVPPVYYSPDARTVDEYYGTLIAATDLPVYAYDNPKATGYSFTVDQLHALVGNGLAGVKVARNDIVYLQQLVAAGVPTWTANADLNAVGWAAGASGAISTITNLVPRLFGALRDAHDAGEGAEVRALQQRVSRFAHDVRTPIIGGLHHGARLLGLPAGAPRRPLRLPTPAEGETIAAAVERECELAR